MSGSDDDHNPGNVFLSLVASIERKPLCRFLGRCPEIYEQRTYKTLRNILRNLSLEEFDYFISDFIHFVKTACSRRHMQFNREFFNICINTIFHWLIVRRGSAEVVRKLMEQTSIYLQTDDSTIEWRSFTLVRSPSPLGGITPLMFVAQTRQCELLKVLLQYGMLERERRPSNIIISILFGRLLLRFSDDRRYAMVMRDLRECLVLCFRVLTYISIADIEMLIINGQAPLIEDWRDCIPESRYLEPCELSHHCRAVLRSCLLLSGGLPDGIKRLPLPTRLQAFLNLES